jgi:hypothetical protein
MSFFPPVGPLGERAGPPVPYQVPASRQEDRHDEDWREEELRRPRRPRRPRHPLTNVLVGIILVVLALAVVVFLISGDSDPGAILGPEDGARLQPGRITFRVRVSAADQPPHWEFAFSPTGGPEAWQQVGGGQSSVQPTLAGRGLLFADISQAGPYRARLIVSDANGRLFEDTVDFTIE